MTDKRVALAAVAGAHGVKGEVRLKLFGDSSAGLASQKHVYVGGVERKLLHVREGGKAAIAGIATVGNDDPIIGALLGATAG
jgi:16S rRNA processing protein RimM